VGEYGRITGEDGYKHEGEKSKEGRDEKKGAVSSR
jgi:hypothetical protein